MFHRENGRARGAEVIHREETPDEPASPYDLYHARCVVVSDGIRPDLADDLCVAILQRAERMPSCPTLNRGGWRSDEIFRWPEPAVSELRRAIERVVRVSPRGLTGWAMVNRRGDSHPRHRHQTAIVSGIYVVHPGSGPPTPTLFEIGNTEVAVAPAPGRLSLFPGDLWHRVPEVFGDGPRVTIAFDVRG